jgi:hypothetical protein
VHHEIALILAIAIGLARIEHKIFVGVIGLRKMMRVSHPINEADLEHMVRSRIVSSHPGFRLLNR